MVSYKMDEAKSYVLIFISLAIFSTTEWLPGYTSGLENMNYILTIDNKEV